MSKRVAWASERFGRLCIFPYVSLKRLGGASKFDGGMKELSALCMESHSYQDRWMWARGRGFLVAWTSVCLGLSGGKSMAFKCRRGASFSSHHPQNLGILSLCLYGAGAESRYVGFGMGWMWADREGWRFIALSCTFTDGIGEMKIVDINVKLVLLNMCQ